MQVFGLGTVLCSVEACGTPNTRKGLTDPPRRLPKTLWVLRLLYSRTNTNPAFSFHNANSTDTDPDTKTQRHRQERTHTQTNSHSLQYRNLPAAKIVVPENFWYHLNLNFCNRKMQEHARPGSHVTRRAPHPNTQKVWDFGVWRVSDCSQQPGVSAALVC